MENNEDKKTRDENEWGAFHVEYLKALMAQIPGAFHVEKKFLLYRLLQQRTYWFVRLRWLVPPLMVLGVGVGLLLKFNFYWQGILGVAGAVLVYNLVFFLLRHWIMKTSKKKLRGFTTIQAGFDYVAMFFLTHYTGGISSPLLIFFIFHIILSSILLKKGFAWILATMAAMGMSMVAFLEYFGLIAQRGGYFRGMELWSAPRSFNHTLIFVLFFIAGVYITAFLTTSVMEVLKEKVINLSRSHEVIEAINELRDRFTMKVAHNLKEPLAATISILNVLSREYTGGLNDKQKDYVSRIDVRLRTMISMINELLTLAQTRSGTKTPKREPIDLCRLVLKVHQFYSERAKAQGLEFPLDIPDAPVMVEGDKDMLEEMIENLVSNAIRYTEIGIVDVKLNARSLKEAIIQVKDSGIGIPKKNLELLFTDFFRADNAKKMQPYGTGLGLALVKQTVEQHGGSIDVRSEEGEGSIFTVNLPLKS
jgi:signal transduction histidine kinase